MYETVLVPTDGSDGTTTTLEHALAVARAHDATLHALSVVDRRQYLAAAEAEQADLLSDLESRAEEAVDDVVDTAEDAGVDSVGAVTEGVPFREIIDYADEHADLLVMGTHGRTGREKRAALGSVTERVVKHAEKPVLSVQIGRNGEST